MSSATAALNACQARNDSGSLSSILTGLVTLIAEVIDKDPREWGYHATIWTAALLVHYLKRAHGIEISEKSVSLAIDRLRMRWKRPRHQLALRPPTWRQSKGG